MINNREAREMSAEVLALITVTPICHDLQDVERLIKVNASRGKLTCKFFATERAVLTRIQAALDRHGYQSVIYPELLLVEVSW